MKESKGAKSSKEVIALSLIPLSQQGDRMRWMIHAREEIEKMKK